MKQALPIYVYSKEIFFSGTALCYSPDDGNCNTPGTISTTSYSFDFTVDKQDNTGELGYKLSYSQVPCGSTIAS